VKTAVVAIGGNAILRSKERGTKEELYANLRTACSYLAQLIREGYDIVFTHGNGPQVGNIMVQNELMREDIPPMPLDVCVAESEGEIGYLLQQALTNELAELGLSKTAVSLITQVLVDKNDPAFKNPTKPIGHYYTKKEAKRLMAKNGWQMAEDVARGGWRRIVPSPKPMKILEKNAIAKLVFSGEDSGIVVIVSGGGGIPVIRTEKGYQGVEAVIDKDLAASVLASDIKERLLIMLTDVPKVALNFGTEHQEDLNKVTLEQIKDYLAQGHFAPGSMGPKIEAAISFLERGGKRVVITTPRNLLRAIREEKGTHIIA
jgi:carbamate kinase